MTRNLKVLGLALVAVFAMSAVAASAASANQWMTAGNVNAKIIADQVAEEQHVFKVEGASTEVKCKTAHFEGAEEISSPATTVDVTPSYSNCNAFLGLSATVTNQGCHYKLHIGSTTGTATWYMTPLTLICTGSNKIVIEAGTCKASVGGEQTFENGVEYMNNGGSPEKGLLTANLSGIKVNKEKDGFLCPLSGTGEVSTGTYEGDTNVTAESGGTPVSITAEGTE